MRSTNPRGNGKLKVYRLYFEPLLETESLVLLGKYFPSASVFKGEGFWKGNAERLMVFEIQTDLDSSVIATLAEELRALNGQEVVRIVHWPVEVWDIKSPV